MKECNFSDESNSKMQQLYIGMCPPSILANTQPGISLFDHNRTLIQPPRIVLLWTAFSASVFSTWVMGEALSSLLNWINPGEMLIGPSPHVIRHSHAPMSDSNFLKFTYQASFASSRLLYKQACKLNRYKVKTMNHSLTQGSPIQIVTRFIWALPI